MAPLLENKIKIKYVTQVDIEVDQGHEDGRTMACVEPGGVVEAIKVSSLIHVPVRVRLRRSAKFSRGLLSSATKVKVNRGRGRTSYLMLTTSLPIVKFSF